MLDKCRNMIDVKGRQAFSDLGFSRQISTILERLGGKSQSTSVCKLRLTSQSNQDRKSEVKKSIWY